MNKSRALQLREDFDQAKANANRPTDMLVVHQRVLHAQSYFQRIKDAAVAFKASNPAPDAFYAALDAQIVQCDEELQALGELQVEVADALVHR